jgi:uncharacterized delta-60 repeat protein
MQAVLQRLLVAGVALAFLGLDRPAQAQGTDPLIITQPQDTAAMVGSAATFFVEATGTAPLYYQWRFGATNIPGATTSALIFGPVSTNSAGQYTVVVTNSSGAITSAPATLVIVPRLPGALDQTFNAQVSYPMVRGMALSSQGRILIGGDFTTVNGVARNGVARLNADGTLDQNFNPGTGTFGVLAVATLPNDDAYVGGDFLTVNSINRARIARLRNDGSVDAAFNPGLGADARVWTIAPLPNGQVLIGGDFQTVNGTNRPHLARLNNDGSLDTSFPAGGGGPAGSVRTILRLADGRLLIGGDFLSVHSIARSRLARLAADGSLDASFDPAAVNGWVFALAVETNGNVVAAGSFNQVNSTPRNGLARFTDSGALDLLFDPTPVSEAIVTSLAVQPDGKILIGGGFTSVDGKQRRRLARLHPDGTVDNLFLPDSIDSGFVESLLLQPDGQVLAAGSFSSINQSPRLGIARFIGADPDPFAPAFLTQPASRSVREGANVFLSARAVGFPEPAYQWQFNGTNLPGATDELLILRNVRPPAAGPYRVISSNSLGSATSVVATVTVSPARTDPGAPDIDFYAGFGPNATVRALARQSDGKLFIGGSFTNVDGLRRNRVARLNTDGSVDSSFVPALGGHSFAAMANVLAIQSPTQLLVGGFIEGLGGAGAGLVRLDVDGTMDTSFAAFAGRLFALAIQGDGRLVIGGGGVASGYIYRLQPDGPVDPSIVDAHFEGGPVLGVVAQSDGKIIVAGGFTSYRQFPAKGILRLNPDATVDSSFYTGSGPNQPVHAVALQADGRIIIAGVFTAVNGVSRHRIARLHPNGAVDSSFDPGDGPDGNVYAVALQPDGRIFIGGDFSEVSGMDRLNIARLHANGAPDLAFDSEGWGTDGTVFSVLVEPSGSAVIGGDFTEVGGVPRPGVARLLGGDSPPSAPLVVGSPMNQAVSAGADVTFSVLARGVPAPSYQWRLNGVDLPGATNWTLTLYNVRVEDAGNYTVSISNPHGTVQSAPALLTVHPPARSPGSPDVNFYAGTGPNDLVRAVAVQPDRKIFIGGAFTEVNGFVRVRIARLLRNGAVDTTFDAGAGADGTVYALALQNDGKIVIGGEFRNTHGAVRPYVSRLDTNGGPDLTFSNAFVGGPVHALAIDSAGRIVIGGIFGVVGDQPRAGIARLNTNGTLDLSFVPATTMGTTVNALAIESGDKILMAGSLVARLNTNGSFDNSFMASSTVPAAYAINLEPDGNALVGGEFFTMAGASRIRLGRLNTNGTADLSFVPAAFNASVHALALQQGILVGGRFTAPGGTPGNRISRLLENGVRDSAFDSGSGVTGGTFFVDEYGDTVDLTAVYAIAPEPGNQFIIGGDFTAVNGVARRYVARLFNRQASDAINILPVATPSGDAVELNWDIGRLQQADEVTGPWQDMQAESPFIYEPGGAQRFFRLKLN